MPLKQYNKKENDKAVIKNYWIKCLNIDPKSRPILADKIFPHMQKVNKLIYIYWIQFDWIIYN